MYRAAGLLCLRRGLSIRKQQEEAAALVSAASIDLRVTDGAQHIFLNGEDVRAQRRDLELTELGKPCDFDTVLAELKERDTNDSTRAFAPLKPAEDSILVDTSALTFDESLAHLAAIIKERL